MKNLFANAFLLALRPSCRGTGAHVALKANDRPECDRMKEGFI